MKEQVYNAIRENGGSVIAPLLFVDVAKQTLTLYVNKSAASSWPVSTSKNGLGHAEGSFKTPAGLHLVIEQIGVDAPVGTVFESRKPCGKLSESEWAGTEDIDRVTSRILWLEGMEQKNQNSHDRYIYIHGTNQEQDLGIPTSQGCIRMGNDAIIDLQGRIQLPPTWVYIA
jgi:hypothetical protein